MAAKTPTEKIEELRAAINDLIRQTDLLRSEFEHLARTFERFEQRAEPVVRDFPVLRSDVAELKRTGDQWGTRLWGVGEKLLIAAVAAALGYYLKR